MMFLPKVTTQTGSALLACDWEFVGISAVSLSLDALLVKPGMALLQELPALSSYVGWKKIIVLNATYFKHTDATAEYQVRSVFDGRILKYTEKELFELIIRLNPDYLMLPSRSWLDPLSSTKIHLIPPRDRNNTDERSAYWDLMDEQTTYLKHENNLWVETETPIRLAVDGVVYHDQEPHIIDLRLPHMAHVFKPLSKVCACEACQMGLTVSHFHHLFTQTPGLCQRFLMQHNAANYAALLPEQFKLEHSTIK